MTKDKRQFLERLKAAAEISHALADKMIELIELREEVRRVEKAVVSEKQNGVKRIARANRTLMQA